MKKLFVVLLALGLLVAFGATASAADVKFGGSYYVTGLYNNNFAYAPSDHPSYAYSRAYFHQRGRLEPVFKIADGLTFTTRLDFLEKHWGDTSWMRGTNTSSLAQYDQPSNRQSVGGSNRLVQENIEWERAYVTFLTAAGQFQVGYQSADAWGTMFGDSETTRPRILYATAFGPLSLLAIYEKFYEADLLANTWGPQGKTDMDGDTYALAGIYKMKQGEAGLLLKYYNVAIGRVAGGADPYRAGVTQIAPYAKMTFGPAFVEAELNYAFGKSAKYEAPSVKADIDVQTWTAYVHGKFNMGPAYVGGMIAYMSGNDTDDATKNKQFLGGGTSWNPALMLANDDLFTWNYGNSGNVNGASIGSGKNNMIFYQIYGGFNPNAKINLEANLSFAQQAKKKKTAAGASGLEYDGTYGTEFDVKATYKLYDNLSYMVGAGYLWVGDYFKAGVATNQIGNDYLLINKLTLSF